ncbi:MAG: asparagine synthase (glutamine-hydrolyzing) [Desulfobacterales bacterium]|nr:MAG: asparagine synthase (glutamine-hydrolyzing) [Desulfobacterales bacterium]
MCGISGILIFKGSSFFLQNIQFMTKAMRRRGPDDEGFAFFEGNSKDTHIFGGKDTPEEVLLSPNLFHPTEFFTGEVPENTILALGHRRLSILDLSAAGHQPMFTEDGRYCIVHNGEIYNYQEIRRKLINKGVPFLSNTDTEVILKAYRAWGESCLHQFNGMWSFAIWDNHDKTLFCSRDRIGIKPFYYLCNPYFFIFASDIKTLIASNIYNPEPNWQGVYHAMSFQCAPRPMTCFKEISSLEQGHYIRIDLKGQIIKKRFWRLPIGEIDHSKSENYWNNHLEDIIVKAVRRRLVSDVPVGIFMSGGIDSTTISAIAAREHPGIKAFTLAYEDNAADFDELPQAQATAAMWPMQHIWEKVLLKKSLAYLDQITRCYEEPFFTLGPTFIVSQLAKKHKVPVVLNGLGPDELFCGYHREHFLGLWKFLHPWLPKIQLFGQQKSRYTKFLHLMSSKDVVEFYISRFSAFSEHEKRELFSFSEVTNWSSYETFKELYGLETLHFSDPIESICYMEVINYIGNHHLYRGDQFTMQWSIESRYPYLDHELVETAFRIPDKYKIAGKQGKYILRKVAKKYIHPTCISAPKKGFGMPVAYWMRGELKSMVENKLEKLKKRNVLKNKKIDELKYRFYANKDGYQKLFFLFSIELWMEAMIDGERSSGSSFN